MKKRALLVLLAICMLVALLPSFNIQATADNTATDAGQVTVSKKSYAIAPGITEYELITNNSSLSAQQAGHVLEVTLGDTASIITGYNDYNIDAIQSGSNWSMKKVTAQAQAAETARGVNVVGAVNGDFFNMSNGAPSGVLVMNGTQIKSTGGSACFWITSDSKAHISSVQEYQDTSETVSEAIGGGPILVSDGKIADGITSTYGETKNPRTVVGIKSDGTVILYEVDGRQAPYSVGMTYYELASMMIKLGCVTAMNLDGGGSSVFATQRAGDSESNGEAGLTVRSSPSDGYERTVSSSLLVVSKADRTGEFVSAVLSPNGDVYTPGSTIQFTASGVDVGGGAAALPTGVEWSVTDGNEIGSINTSTGLFTANTNVCGTVKISLTYGGKVVGTTSVELQWPDTLGFTNTSISLDFSQTSDLSFYPTYKGMYVNYKDGDFTWSISPSSYKHTVVVSNGYSLAITSDSLGKEQQVKTEKYTVTDLVEQYTNNQKTVKATVKQESNSNSQDYTFGLCSFENNKFKADDTTSLRGTVVVSLVSNTSVTGSVDVVVGMEPYVLMDFEDHSINGTTTSAEKFWTVHIGSRTGATGVDRSAYLTSDEVKNNRLWFRDTNNKGIGISAGLVSSDNDSNVRFGQYAFQLTYNFTAVKSDDVASADFGFSGDVLVDTVQPTKIGLWINVPNKCEKDDSVLKAILKGSAYESAKSTSYVKWGSDGTEEYVENYELTGTAAYVQYYSYDANGEISGSKLSDWAGKGWIWVEADISAYQMPVDLCRAYLVRITSAQNVTKSSGYIYIDNLQFIYGTNTNDTINPSIDTVSETSTGTALLPSVSTTLNISEPSFEVTFSDSGKYATGIDSDSARVYIDGVNQTEQATVSTSNLKLSGIPLTNGTHTLKVSVKDFYGNETTATYPFVIAADGGTVSAVNVEAQEDSPSLGQGYEIYIKSTNSEIMSCNLTMEISDTYAAGITVSGGEGYTASGKYSAGKFKITVTRGETSFESSDRILATVTLCVPEDLQEGEKLTYSVSTGSYVLSGSAITFSTPEVSVPITASYRLSTSNAVQDYETLITVTDEEGRPVSGLAVYSDGSQIGITDSEGKLKKTYTGAGRKTLYAKSASGVERSWNTDVVICAVTDENAGKPIGVQNVASSDSDSGQVITWLTSMQGEISSVQSIVRYSTDSGLTDYIEATGSNEILTFAETNSGTAMRVNTVQLKDLSAGSTYYYQVGYGEKWSDTYSFTTSADTSTASTNFFVIGDIQTTDTTNLTAAINKITAGTTYDFGIQTGDAIDDVTKYANWRSFFTVLNSGTLPGVDLIHVMGNHEYYGDAEGTIAGSIFAIPTSQQGGFYSVEYGSVYVGVINDGGDIDEALKELQSSAAESDCTWKILTIHEPIYGTTSEMDASKRKKITSVIEAAGIDMVFSGDDHAYARTYPMLNDVKQAENSTEGVVYFISGDLSSKSNAFTTHDYFAEAISHVTYTGMYLSVAAGDTSITVTAYDYQGNLLDSYTKSLSACEQGEHTFGETSVYDPGNGTITCAICGKKVQAAESHYTGKVATINNGGYVVLSDGVLKTGWFAWGEEIYYADEDGILHETTTTNTATCLKNGHIEAYCKDINETYIGAFTWATGHTWNDDHVCTICGAKGIDIAAADVKVAYKYYSYTGADIRPSSTGTYDGKTLVARSSRAGTDAYISYSNNSKIGVATVKYEGRGNYYGEKTATFTIVPQNVNTVTASVIGKDSITLSWESALGAGEYMVQQKVDGAWEKIGTTAALTYTATGLETDTEYSFRVFCRTQVEGKYYYCIDYSEPLTVSTYDPTLYSSTYIKDIRVQVDAISVAPQSVDGEQYLFLPAAVDPKKLSVSFTVDGCADSISVAGSGATITLTDYSQEFDLTQIAEADSSGIYKISVSIGGRKPITLSIMKSAQIRSLYLTSDDAIQKGRSYVEASKENEATGSIILLDAEGNELYNGALKQIKTRGNSTFTYDKKSYQIKLDKKTDLLNSGEKVKTWVLLAGYCDATLMHDKLIKDLASSIGMNYVASCDWVDLYYDGVYRGTYLLSEKNSINGTGVNIEDMEEKYEKLNSNYGSDAQTSIGVNKYEQSYQYTSGLTDPEDITGGYLIELNRSSIDEACGFYTTKGVAFNIKSPEWCSDKAAAYISEYYQEFEDAVYATDSAGNYTGYNAETELYYYDYCDLDSLVQMYLIQQFGLNSDGFYSSLYFYKDSNSKMCVGPVWDQELTFGTGWSKYISADSGSYTYLTQALIKIPGFKQAVKEYIQSTFLPEAKKLIGDNGTLNDYYAKVVASAQMNYVLWPYMRLGKTSASGSMWAAGTDYDDVFTDLTKWVTARLELLAKTSGLPEETINPNDDNPGDDTGDAGHATTEQPSSLDNLSITVAGETDESGITKASVTSSAVINLIKAAEEAEAQGQDAVLEICVGTASATKSVELAIPAKVFENIAQDTDAAVRIDAGIAIITLDAVAVDTIFETMNGKDISISVSAVDVSSLDSEAQRIIGARPVYDFSVLAGENQITSFGSGSATVSISYVPQPQENVNAIVVYAVDSTGLLHPVRGAYNSATATVDFSVSHFSRYAIGYNLVDFLDVIQRDWYYNSTVFCAARGITTGTTETTFSPGEAVTRGQFIVMLMRAYGIEPDDDPISNFADAGDTYYTSYLAKAKELGISNGTGNNLFLPDATITRQDMFTLLYRALNTLDELPDASSDKTLSDFEDAGEVANYAKDAVTVLVEGGIVSGSDGKLNPEGQSSRAQMVQVLYNLLSK